MLRRPFNAQQVGILSLIFFFVIIVRCYYVKTFAVTLPFWDQWDAEGDFLLKPWVEGRLKPKDLWEPHNEHRIFPTRILSILIFEITGEWNNLTEAFVNILLASLVPVILIWALLKKQALSGMRWMILPVLLAQFGLPFSFENLLIGFQSQFYFLMLFTLTSLILAAYRPNDLRSMIGILILCLLSIITMGSGLLTAVSVSAIYLIQWYMDRKVSPSDLLMIIICLIIAVSGFILIPHIKDNQGYRAQNLSQLFNALGYILSWPVSGRQFPALLLWLPAIIVIPLLLFQRKLSTSDLLMAGCFIWSFSQSLAIAYGRGQELTEVSSRYTELFTLGLVSNAWFAVRVIQEFPSYAVRWTSLLFFGTLFYGHVRNYPIYMHDMRKNHRYSVIQTENVSMYLKTGDTKYLRKPQYEIPFPDSTRLRELLDNKTIRSILPKPMSDFVQH